jgi:ribulose-phosphate 3-epimerase
MSHMLPHLKIAPSLLSADFGRLGEEAQALTKAGADWLHVDVMDGHYVPNITMGPSVMKGLTPHTTLPLDVHLMVTNPDVHLKAFREAGASVMTVHPDTTHHLQRTLATIRSLGAKAGVALNPATSPDFLPWIMDDVDLILVMSVNPGFGGQPFLTRCLEKIAYIRGLIGTRSIELEVDGGITPDTAPLVRAAGATILVAGTAVFKTPDYAQNIQSLRA